MIIYGGTYNKQMVSEVANCKISTIGTLDFYFQWGACSGSVTKLFLVRELLASTQQLQKMKFISAFIITTTESTKSVVNRPLFLVRSQEGIKTVVRIS